MDKRIEEGNSKIDNHSTYLRGILPPLSQNQVWVRGKEFVKFLNNGGQMQYYRKQISSWVFRYPVLCGIEHLGNDSNICTT